MSLLIIYPKSILYLNKKCRSALLKITFMKGTRPQLTTITLLYRIINKPQQCDENLLPHMKSVCISNMIRRTILKRCLYDFRDVTTLNKGNVLSKAVGQPTLPETSKLLLNSIGRHQRLSGNNWCNEIGSSPKCGIIGSWIVLLKPTYFFSCFYILHK